MVDILYIALICVLIVDISGFIDEMEGILSKWLHIKAHIPKPFSCSLCLSHWLGLIYITATHQLTLQMYAYVLFVACMSSLMSQTYWLIHTALQTLISKINDYLYFKVKD